MRHMVCYYFHKRFILRHYNYTVDYLQMCTAPTRINVNKYYRNHIVENSLSLNEFNIIVDQKCLLHFRHTIYIMQLFLNLRYKTIIF